MPHDTKFEAYFGGVAQSSAKPAPPMPAISSTTFLPSFLRRATDRAGSSSGPSRSRHVLTCRLSAADFERVLALEQGSASTADMLMDLAASIEPDGMSGKDADERVSATILALLAFVSHGHIEHRGAFRSHVGRLIRFLESPLSLSSERARILAGVLELVRKGIVPPDDWLTMIRNPENAWKEIESALQISGN
jgi:hypothetical protein